MQAKQEIKEVVPRVTAEDVEAAIFTEYYYTAAQGMTGAKLGKPYCYPRPLDCITHCVLTLHNGFTVTGESYCITPETFDPEIGRKNARRKAVEKIWPLLAYALKERLPPAAPPADRRERLVIELTDLAVRAKKLSDFMRSDGFESIAFDERMRLRKQEDVMYLYIGILKERISALG